MESYCSTLTNRIVTQDAVAFLEDIKAQVLRKLIRTSVLVSWAMHKRTLCSKAADIAVRIHFLGSFGEDCSQTGIALLCKTSDEEDLRKARHPLWTAGSESFVRAEARLTDEQMKISARYFQYIFGVVGHIIRGIVFGVSSEGDVGVREVTEAVTDTTELHPDIVRINADPVKDSA